MKIATILFALLLSACASQPLIVKEAIPIPCPKHNFPPKPVLPIYSLSKNSSASEKVKALIASLYLQNKWIDEVYDIKS